MLEQFVVHHLNRLGPKSDLSLPHTPRHLLFQLLKSAAYYEENVPGVDRLAFCLAASLKFECGL
jgi:hypothetical protein